MAGELPHLALREAAPTPIAQLRPDNVDSDTRVLDGVVTITWPYSTVTNSIAFIIAEHDVLLRRNQGQLRVEFHGTLGKALAHANVGGGDRIRLSLKNAQWIKNDAKAGLPAGSLDWQLKYANRALLSVSRDASQEPEVLELNSPESGGEDASAVDSLSRIATPVVAFDAQYDLETTTPKPQSPLTTGLTKRLASSTFEQDEYASPAFMKRARVSYGSLFEGDADPFSDKRTKDKHNRRKSRFSMGNTVWSYISRSPSPEHEVRTGVIRTDTEPSEEPSEADFSATPVLASRSVMVDEGCQTQELQFSPSLKIGRSPERHLGGDIAHDSSIPAYTGEYGASMQTPSRTLFDHLNASDNLTEAFGQHVDTGMKTNDAHHPFGFGLPIYQTDEVSNAFGGEDRAMAGSTRSMAPTSESVKAAEYPCVALAEHVYPKPEAPGGQSFHYSGCPDETPSIFHSTASGNSDWRIRGTAAYPTIPEQRPQEHTTLVVGSPLPHQEPGSQELDCLRSPCKPDFPDDELPTVDDAAQLSDAVLGDREGENSEQSDSSDDGGDLKGEDYDLRNYAHTRYDDGLEDESEDDHDSDESDAENQPINFDGEDDEFDEAQVGELAAMDDKEDECERDESEAEEDGKQWYEQKLRASLARVSEEFVRVEDEGSTDAEQKFNGEFDDEEGENYDADRAPDEHDYDEDSDSDSDSDSESGSTSGGDGDDEEERLSTVYNGPNEPVFIDLLSDSEDEGQEEAEENCDIAVKSSMLEAAKDQPFEPLMSTQSKTSSPDAIENLADDEEAKDIELQDAASETKSGEIVDSESGKPLVNATEGPDMVEAAKGSEKDEDEQEDEENEDEEEVEAEAAKLTQKDKPLDGGDAMSVDDLVAQPADEIERDIEDGAWAVADNELMKDTRVVITEKDESITQLEVSTHGQGLRKDALEIHEQKQSEEPWVGQLDLEMTDDVTADEVEEPAGKWPRSETANAEVATDSIQQPIEVLAASLENQQIPTRVQTPVPQTQVPETTNTPESSWRDEDDSVSAAAAEQQIMSETREYNSPHWSRHAADRGKEEASQENPQSQDSDALIMVNSFQRHTHWETHLSGSTSSLIEDPSLLLAQSSSQADDDENASTEKEEMEEVLPEQEVEGKNQNAKQACEAGIYREPSSPSFPPVSRGIRSDQADPSILLAKASVESPNNAGEPSSPIGVSHSMTERAESEEQKGSYPVVGTKASRRLTTPEQRQRYREDQESLISPSVSSSFAEDEPLSVLKRQLSKDLLIKLPDYISLRTLRNSFNKITDILAIATSTPAQPSRPKHGPRDYMLELTLVDPSSAPTGATIGQLYRPHQASLPVVHAGDVVLLRRVQVVALKGRGFGVRITDASAWAVFEKADSEMLPQIKGPPVEVADEEVDYATGLRMWWAALDEKALDKIHKATQKLLHAEG